MEVAGGGVDVMVMLDNVGSVDVDEMGADSGRSAGAGAGGA